MADETSGENLSISRGGPFYSLQSYLKLIRDGRLQPLLRAFLFITITWTIPLAISFLEGNAAGAYADRPFLLSFSAWARFFLSIGVFILMEEFVENRVETLFRPLLTPPLLIRESRAEANAIVHSAIKRRNSSRAEIICLGIAIGLSIISFYNTHSLQHSSWAFDAAVNSGSPTWAGTWCFAISSPLFFFLLGRWIWRLIVLSLLLSDISRLNLRLTVSHPDGFAGVGVVSTLPNIFTPFVFAVSCVAAAVVAELVILGDIQPTSYATVVVIWFVFVHANHALLLLPFSKTLIALKSKTIEICTAQATEREYRLERSILGKNIVETGDDSDEDVKDATGLLNAAKKLPSIPFNRSTLLPVSAAALIPFIAVGAVFLPLKEMIGLLKKLLLL